MTSERDVQQIERKLIEVLIELDGYRGDIVSCHDVINACERAIEAAENRKDALIGDWYNAN